MLAATTKGTIPAVQWNGIDVWSLFDESRLIARSGTAPRNRSGSSSQRPRNGTSSSTT
jgi:hypothetical protein